jgi:hypothetical protein
VEPVVSTPDGLELEAVIAALRSAGARFALAFGSRAGSEEQARAPRADSDLDVGAWWGSGAPDSWRVDLPAGVDLLVLDTAPLAIGGRVAMWGVLLFDDDPPARVRWQADTRKRYVDERPRREQADADFAAAVRDG